MCYLKINDISTYTIAVYIANTQYKEVNDRSLPGISLLQVEAEKYVKENNIHVKNDKRWKDAFPFLEGRHLPIH